MTLCLKELESVVRRVFLTLVRPARHAHEGGAHVAEGVVHVRAVGVGQAGDAGAGGGAEGGAGAERLDALLAAGAGGAVARDAAGRIDHADGGRGHVSRAHAVCARERKKTLHAGSKKSGFSGSLSRWLALHSAHFIASMLQRVAASERSAQLALAKHSTHTPATLSQTGVGGGHSLLREQLTTSPE